MHGEGCRAGGLPLGSPYAIGVRIQLNGEPRELAGPLSIAALLDELGIDSRLVAVEHNRIVVKRQRYAETLIQEGAEIEIVSFVGGGAGSSAER